MEKIEKKLAGRLFGSDNLKANQIIFKNPTPMIIYCQDENINDIEKAFECKKVEQCEEANDGNRLGKRQCIKKLCKEKMFADTCHCKKGRRERKKCFKTLEKDDL